MNAGEEAFLLKGSRMTIKHKVLDLLRPVTLDIQQSDIDAARDNADGTYNCPSIRAAKRLFPKHDVFVGRHIVTITAEGLRPWSHQRTEPNDYEDFVGGDALYAFTYNWDTQKKAKPTRIPLKRTVLYDEDGRLNVKALL